MRRWHLCAVAWRDELLVLPHGHIRVLSRDVLHAHFAAAYYGYHNVGEKLFLRFRLQL